VCLWHGVSTEPLNETGTSTQSWRNRHTSPRSAPGSANTASWLAWLHGVVAACSLEDEQRGEASCPPDPRDEVPPFPTLRRKNDFDALARDGTARSSQLLVLRTLRTDGATTRIGFSTPRSLGGAVQRNRVRRRLRSLVRERYGELGTGWDLLVIARPAAAQATYADLRKALTNVLRRSEIGR
jgi:ribonuclease P protein component